MAYRKTTLEIDLDELRHAAEQLGTHGIKETVNAALREVNRRAGLHITAAQVRAGALRTPAEKSAAWLTGPKD